SSVSGDAIGGEDEQMARTFIAGSPVTDATPALTHLWTEGKGWSVDLLGEATISDQEADRYRDRCVEALETLAPVAQSWKRSPLLEQDHWGPVPRVQLSLKISALSPHVDPIDPEGSFDSVAQRPRPIVIAAIRAPAP